MNTPLLLLLGGCGAEGGAPGGLPYEPFLLDPQVHLLFAPTDAPEGPETWLGAWESTWQLRDRPTDEDWDEAPILEALPIAEAAGLRVADQLVLPDVLLVGQETDGVTVVAVGAAEVWYGTFDDAVTVEIADGRFAGEQIFAAPLGPVRLTLDGTSRDLVSYDPP